MTDRPYTGDDLRAEAARQHRGLTRTADAVVVGDQMDQEAVASTQEAGDPRTWAELLECEGDITPAYEEAQAKVHHLITRAADVSEWAVNLGADGLEPTEHTIQLGIDPGDGNRPRVRLHFAFHPDMTDADRDSFVMALSKVVLRNL